MKHQDYLHELSTLSYDTVHDLRRFSAVTQIKRHNLTRIRPERTSVSYSVKDGNRFKRLGTVTLFQASSCETCCWETFLIEIIPA